MLNFFDGGIRHPVFPPFITIEPASVCNLHCPECVTGSGTLTRYGGFMRREVFQRIVSEAARKSIYINLYFQGEPFLNPELKHMVQMAGNMGLYTALSTNGHFLQRENCRNMIEAGLSRLIVSLDGTGEESYRMYRKGGDFHKVVEGIRQMSAEKEKAGKRYPFIEVQMLVHKHNQNEKPGFRRFAFSLGAGSAVFKSMQVLDLQRAPEWLDTTTRPSRYRRGSNLEFNPATQRRTACRNIYHSCVVTADGGVFPCCYDKNGAHPLGSIAEKSLQEIWQSEAFMKFRMRVRSEHPPGGICRNCY